jgi:acetyl-CoA acetyltransferase
LISDRAAEVLIARGERARDLRQKPVRVIGMQGTRAGREEFIFAPRGLGINQQSAARAAARPVDLEVFAQAGVKHKDVQGFYTYDAFSPLVLFALERFGYCGPGEAALWVQDGRIEPGGALPVNTSGGLLSEAHVAGWNSICEMARQLRGTAGPSQIPDAQVLHWGTAWGDAVILTA